MYPCSQNMINFLSWSSLCTHAPKTWSIFYHDPPYVPMLPKHDQFFIMILPVYPCSQNMINFLSWSSLCTHAPETWSIFLSWSSLYTHAPETWSIFYHDPPYVPMLPKHDQFFYHDPPYIPMLLKHDQFFIMILPMYPCSQNMINFFIMILPMYPCSQNMINFLSWSSLCTHAPKTWSIFYHDPPYVPMLPKHDHFFYPDPMYLCSQNTINFWILILLMHPCSSQQAKPKVKNWNQHPGKIKDRPSETTPWGECPLTTVDFIRPISAVIVPVTDPRLGHALVVLAAELPGLTRPQDALLLVRVVPAVVVQVADVEGEGAVVVLALELAWRALLLRCSWHINRMKVNVRPGLLVHSGFIVLMNRKMIADSRDKKVKGLRVQAQEYLHVFPDQIFQDNLNYFN